MKDKRRYPHPLSPVQPQRRGIAFVVLGLVLILFTAWSLRDRWVDDLSPPYKATSSQSIGKVPTLPAPISQKLPRTAMGSLTGLIRPSDYPEDALQRNEQGTVEARLHINARGFVSRCVIVSSSGSASLDSATCSILSRRARFEPALDGQGVPTTGTFQQHITWRLEG